MTDSNEETKQDQDNSNWRKRPRKISKGINPAHGVLLSIDFEGLNKQTRLYKKVEAMKDELRDYVGTSSPASELLVQRIIFKSIRCSYFEATDLTNEKPGDLNAYLALSNSLRLDLNTLKNLAGKAKAPDLADYINSLTEVKNNGDQTGD